jgi:hypothetical protein
MSRLVITLNYLREPILKILKQIFFVLIKASLIKVSKVVRDNAPSNQ